MKCLIENTWHKLPDQNVTLKMVHKSFVTVDFTHIAQYWHPILTHCNCEETAWGDKEITGITFWLSTDN